jgi:hypothetical protein
MQLPGSVIVGLTKKEVKLALTNGWIADNGLFVLTVKGYNEL